MGEAARRAFNEAQEKDAAKKAIHDQMTGGLTPQQMCDRIGELHRLLQLKFGFKKGDLITPKEGLNDFNVPQPGYPVIVHEVLANPVIDENQKDPTHNRFHRQYDIVIMAWINGAFMPFHAESARFKPWEVPEEKSIT